MCDRRFKKKKQLKNHRSRNHDTGDRFIAAILKGNYRCKICDLWHATKGKLRVHEKQCKAKNELKAKGGISEELSERTEWSLEQQPPRKTPLQKIQESNQHRLEKMKDRISNLPFTRKLRRDATEALKNREAEKKRQRRLEENAPVQKQKWDTIKLRKEAKAQATKAKEENDLKKMAKLCYKEHRDKVMLR